MAEEEYRPPMKEFLEMLADLLSEKYFERMDDRMKKIPELRTVDHSQRGQSVFEPFNGYDLPDGRHPRNFPTSRSGTGSSSMSRPSTSGLTRHLVREKEMEETGVEA